MRAVFSIISIIMFLSSQGLAHSCLDNCSHHQKNEMSHATGHDCCDDAGSTKKEEKTHKCNLGHCFKSADIETSVLSVESRVEKKHFDFVINPVGSANLFATLQENSIRISHTDRWRYPPKVPLYIAYQKLLLP